MRGFTIVEVMVSLALMGILAATAIINSAKNADRDIRLEKDRTVSFLRDLQNRSLTGQKEGISLTGKLCGFGVYRESGERIRTYYVQTLGSDRYDQDCKDVSNAHTNGTLFEEFNMKNGVAADSFSDIFFMVPDGDVYQGGSGPVNASIFFYLRKSSLAVPVTIEPGGKIR